MSSIACRGIRGATIAEGNTSEHIINATKELLQELIKANNIATEDVASAIFTTTRDLNAEFPAVGARQLGWDEVPLLCGHEMDVPDAMKSVVRILLMVNTNKPANAINHVYLKEAVRLRSRGSSQ
ncbi:chorismate mutase [Dehalococcoidia bacterium]|nr:chorismate mutase [Dehalococcoidia bacterium]